VIGTMYITISHCVRAGSELIQLPEHWEPSPVGKGVVT
jgi:hypothetical protein